MSGDSAPAPVKPAGDFDYEANGSGYSAVRRTDPTIARLVLRGLGTAISVINVGAGAGSYEPPDLQVTPVEPSAFMRSQRLPHRATSLNVVAEHLPFLDASFDAAMAMVTVHQWSDADRGLSELRRVSRGPVMIPIPIDCTDGFTEAFYARPERFLDPAVRRSQSAWGFVSPEVGHRAVERLRGDVESGEWERSYGAARELPEFHGSLRLIVATPSSHPK